MDDSIDSFMERRDDEQDTMEPPQYSYRFFDYTHSWFATTEPTDANLNEAIWDDLMKLHLQATEGRDDVDCQRRNIRLHGTDDDDDIIIHRNLLRRRHVRKIQKERSSAITNKGRQLATSPMQKKESTPQQPPSIDTASPCAFFMGRKPHHSPIRPDASAARTILVGNGDKNRMKSSLQIMTEETNKSSEQSTAASSGETNKKKQNLTKYPEMSPIRCAKRRKLFTASRTADCVVMS